MQAALHGRSRGRRPAGTPAAHGVNACRQRHCQRNWPLLCSSYASGSNFRHRSADAVAAFAGDCRGVDAFLSAWRDSRCRPDVRSLTPPARGLDRGLRPPWGSAWRPAPDSRGPRALQQLWCVQPGVRPRGAGFPSAAFRGGDNSPTPLLGRFPRAFRSRPAAAPSQLPLLTVSGVQPSAARHASPALQRVRSVETIS